MTGRGRIADAWRGVPAVPRALAGLVVLVLAYGTVVHVVQLIAGGGHPYARFPGWLAGYFTALVLLDPLAAVLLALRTRAGSPLAVLVLATDAAANAYANLVASPAAGGPAGRVAPVVIGVLAVALLAVTPALWRSDTTCSRITSGH